MYDKFSHWKTSFECFHSQTPITRRVSNNRITRKHTKNKLKKKNLPTEKFSSDFSSNVGEETCEERQSAIKDWKPLVGSRKVFSILYV